MADWIVTLPKTVKWEEYEKELKAVEDRSAVLNYRAAFKYLINPGDRCFLSHCNEVIGWMEITGLAFKADTWKCETTGRMWPRGYYLQRSGTFNYIPKERRPIKKGFRGIHKFEEGSKF